ncbi:Transcription factor RF2b-like protein [Drosera capensis]
MYGLKLFSIYGLKAGDNFAERIILRPLTEPAANGAKLSHSQLLPFSSPLFSSANVSFLRFPKERAISHPIMEHSPPHPDDQLDLIPEIDLFPSSDNVLSVDYDDLLASYLATEKSRGQAIEKDGSFGVGVDDVIAAAYGGLDRGEKSDDCGDKSEGRRFHRSQSWDCLSNEALNEKVSEAKKAMTPEKLAELWTVDPKRAKRILANRQSAARSKERKARYIVELEKKVQFLRTEATTLAAQLSLYEKDTNRLSAENTELRHQLESLEQQAQLCSALNEALEQEVDRLRMATREALTPTDPYMVRVQYIACKTPFLEYPHTKATDSPDSGSYRIDSDVLGQDELANSSKLAEVTFFPLETSPQQILPAFELDMAIPYKALDYDALDITSQQIYSLLETDNICSPCPPFIDLPQAKMQPCGVESDTSGIYLELCASVPSPMHISVPYEDHLDQLQESELSGRASHLVML